MIQIGSKWKQNTDKKASSASPPMANNGEVSIDFKWKLLAEGILQMQFWYGNGDPFQHEQKICFLGFLETLK